MKLRLALLTALVLAPPGNFPAVAADNQAEVLFVRRIAPLLQQKCLACHGGDEKDIKGGFDLRTRAALLKGDDSDESQINDFL